MQVREFSSSCVDEVRSIMAREWSSHAVEPLEPGLAMHFRLRRISPETSLSFLSYGTAVGITPVERDNVVLIQMPVRGTAAALFPDSEVALHPTAFAAIDARHVRRATFSADYQMLVLRIRMPRLEQRAQALLGRRPQGALRFSPELPRGGVAWRGWQPVAAALAVLDADPLEMPDAVLAPLEEAALSSLLLFQPNSYSAELSRPAASVAPKHVVRAEQFIHGHLHLPLTTEMIAAHVEVSIRALFDGFRAFRGVSPAAYVREARLERARVDLAESGSSVASVAARWGFSHAANFAALYRKRYGEAPGHTSRFGAGGRKS